MRVRIPQGTTWIGSPMQRVRRDWRTRMRIKDWSSYWWGCITSRVKMRSNFLMMSLSGANLDLMQNSDFFDGPMMREYCEDKLHARWFSRFRDDLAKQGEVTRSVNRCSQDARGISHEGLPQPVRSSDICRILSVSISECKWFMLGRYDITQ